MISPEEAVPRDPVQTAYQDIVRRHLKSRGGRKAPRRVDEETQEDSEGPSAPPDTRADENHVLHRQQVAEWSAMKVYEKLVRNRNLDMNKWTAIRFAVPLNAFPRKKPTPSHTTPAVRHPVPVSIPSPERGRQQKPRPSRTKE